MPEWLMSQENYNSKQDKDTFVNKSILSLLTLLSKIKAQSGHKEDMFKINATFKVAFTLLTVLLVALTRSFTFVLIINVYLLVVLSSMRAIDIIKIIRISFLMTLFTFIMLIPALIWGNYYSALMITFKVFATVTAINILSGSTKWNSITSALKRFFIPDIFILVFDITIKYIYILGEFALNMLYALKLRSVGVNKSKYTSLSGIAGTMFLKSEEMAEDMYSAMQCRGFTGEYKAEKRFKVVYADFIYLIIVICIILLYFYLAGDIG